MVLTEWSPFEARAQRATQLPSFPLNLRSIRSSVEQLLKEVGRYGFFNEYTDHSIQHVDAMLRTAEWLVPERTKELMTDAECLLLVLAIYFHDVGMLISRNEFELRATNTDFQKFKAEPVISTAHHEQFAARLAQLPQNDAERIWFEEFVRYTHGQRIRSWIEGIPTDANDSSKDVRIAIASLFEKADPAIRRDLALICESHTKDDIGDIAKYKLSQPYGETSGEEANLQYVAAILRTVDLLQITKKRAPLVLFQIINPTDPLSQIEWRKQNAVRTVRPQPARDKDGNAVEEAQSSVIEVHAQFQEAEGFFGLTSYLIYAEKEIASCYSAVSKSAKKVVRKLEYPWDRFDSTGVEASGFLTESFGFSLDQQKILDLLTGHTLYNDTTVVLRELTQNALDAVRLQKSMEADGGGFQGEIEIRWNSKSRELSIIDNGTGMSQEVVINHLLKVGSSRYQDPAFKEKHPNFSSISRFGIGVLSAFMVSDDVEITTCSPDDENARRIALRSVHGKYLIKLFDKVADRDEIGVAPHGTRVKLVIRPTASVGNVLEIARMWLLFPRCKVNVCVDDDPPQVIGFENPRQAIEAYIASVGSGRLGFGERVEVREVEKNGVALAFAVSQGSLFKDWSFVQVREERQARMDPAERPPIATCIEGVGVEFATPGFRGATILAIVNAVGPSAPKTNVARSAIEDTLEQREMLATIYDLFAGHVVSEIERLSSEEGYSLTRAVREAPYIASTLIGNGVRPTRPAALDTAMANVPTLIAESRKHGRRKLSLSQIKSIGRFRTIESPLTRSIENFVREAPTDITARSMFDALKLSNALPLEDEVIVNFGSSAYAAAQLESDFEVTEVLADESSRRLEAVWTLRGRQRLWIRSPEVYALIAKVDRRFWELVNAATEGSRGVRGRKDRLLFAIGSVKVEGLAERPGFAMGGEQFLVSHVGAVQHLSKLWGNRESLPALKELAICVLLVESWLSGVLGTSSIDENFMRRSFEPSLYPHIRSEVPEIGHFFDVMRGSEVTSFNPFAWDRRTENGFSLA